MTERAAPVECRLEGRTLHGVALRYGEQARDRPERFEAGAFAPLGVVTLNLQHDRFREDHCNSTDGRAPLRDQGHVHRGTACGG